MIIVPYLPLALVSCLLLTTVRVTLPVAPQHHPDLCRRRSTAHLPHLVHCFILSHGLHRVTFCCPFRRKSCRSLDEQLIPASQPSFCRSGICIRNLYAFFFLQRRRTVLQGSCGYVPWHPHPIQNTKRTKMTQPTWHPRPCYFDWLKIIPHFCRPPIHDSYLLPPLTPAWEQECP